jgi:DNA-binding MurR/RpiR family transcriptional regulator
MSTTKSEENIIALIEHKRGELTKAQELLADYVLENIDEIGFQTYSQISEGSNVSEASFIRFLRVLGYDSFSEFKEEVRHYIRNRTSPSIRMKETIAQIEKNKNVFQNTLKIDMAMLQEVEENLMEQDISMAVQLIKDARRIYVAGFGISRSIVEFIDFRFNRVGYPISNISIGGAEVVERLFSATKEDVIITIGFFRPHREMEIIYSLAKKRGISIITITDSFASPLTKGASIVFHARRGPRETLTSLVAPMSVANILSIALASVDQNRALASFSELDEMKNEYDL